LSYICVTNVFFMKKKLKEYTIQEDAISMVNEPVAMFISTPVLPFLHKQKTTNTLSTKEFTYKNFKKIIDKSPFTIAEWATLLFISERTLQRYAKENSNFGGLHIERILHLEKLINAGNELFGKNKFGDWLQEPLFHFKGNTAFNQLTTFEGINEVYTLIGRIEHGICA
jgi:Protein of unknown function (DUF2384)